MSTFLVLGILIITLLFIITVFCVLKLGIDIEKSLYDEFDTPFTKADIVYLESLSNEFKHKNKISNKYKTS